MNETSDDVIENIDIIEVDETLTVNTEMKQKAKKPSVLEKKVKKLCLCCNIFLKTINTETTIIGETRGNSTSIYWIEVKEIRNCETKFERGRYGKSRP